jgi:O-antigen ligase
MKFFNLKSIAIFVFIISLVPGDTFYGDIGLTQSFFTLPLLFVYIFSGKYLPSIKLFTYAVSIFIFILTLHLITALFSGFVEWYRTIGGPILAVMMFTLCSNKVNNEDQISWLAILGAIPIVAFFCGGWQPFGDTLRLTFLKHDPNHLGHLIIYSIITVLAVVQKLKKVGILIAIAVLVIYFIPLAFTFSRTSLIIFAIILCNYYYFFLGGQAKVIFVVLALIFGFYLLQSTENLIILGFVDRFSETDETRSLFLENGLKIIGDNFLMGVGVDNFVDPNWRLNNGFSRSIADYDGVVSLTPTSTHNGFLDILLIGGLFLFLTFITLIIFPALFLLFKSNYFEDNKKMRWTKFLVYSFIITFLLINTTYSLYNSKLGWWGIGFSYLLINPYYSTYVKFNHTTTAVQSRKEHFNGRNLI